MTPTKRSLIATTATLALAACQDTGIDRRTGSGTCTYGTADYETCLVDATAAIQSYTPDTCSYTVSTPEVPEFTRGFEEFGPDAAPDRVHASIAGPSSSTFAVGWHTDLLTRSTWVVYGNDATTVSGANGPGAGVTAVRGHSMVIRGGIGGSQVMRHHETHVCGLTADTEYFYKVGGPGHWSRVYSLRTAPVAGTTASWSFIASGDSRSPSNNEWAKSQKDIAELPTAPRLQMFSGDAVFLGVDQVQWGNFFSASEGGVDVSESLAQIPFMPANGNHDGLSVSYVGQFALPQAVSAGESSSGEEWYSFDYANAHFIVLNDTVSSTDVITAQTQWLQTDLAAVDRGAHPWIFVFHHKPLYTCLSNHAPEVNNRAAWQPVFDQYQVDFVLAGHNHVYERSKPIRGLDASNNGIVASSGANGVPTITAGVPSGTVYMVSAGVGAELYPVSTSCPFTQAAQSVNQYAIFEVAGRTLSMTVRDYLTGTTIDSLTYTK